MRRINRDGVGVVVLAVVLFFANLGGPRLWDRDEPRNAGCAVEMLQRGDWVVPVFNDELRAHKPVLLYWLMMGAYALWGVSEFSARFWSALLSVGTVWTTYAIGRRLFHPRVGLWAAIVLSTSTMFCVAARAATPDATLTFFTTAALGVFVWSAWLPAGRGLRPANETTSPVGMDSSPNHRWPFPAHWLPACLLYGLMAIATLAKGPVGFVLPTAVIGMFCLVMRAPATAGPGGCAAGTRWPVARRTIRRTLSWWAPGHFLRTCWVMRPLTAITALAVIAGPWYALVGVRTQGDWLRGFLGEHNLGRALAPMEGHGGPPYYYLVAILVGMFPWSIVALPTWLHNRRAALANAWQYQGTAWLACWAGVYVVLFTLAQTKLPSYVIPAYPALAMLVANYLHAWEHRGERVSAKWLPAGFVILACLGGLMAAGLVIAARTWLAGDLVIASVAVVPLLGGLLGAIWCGRDLRQLACRTLFVTAALQTLLVFAWLSDRVSGYRQDLSLLAAMPSQASSPPLLASFRRLEPSWVFYAGRPIVEFNDAQIRQLHRFSQQSKAVYVLTTEAGAERLNAVFPGAWDSISSAPYFLHSDRMVLLTRQALPRMAAATATRDATAPRETAKD